MEFFILEHVCYVFFLHRLKKMPQSMPEYALTRNYLELMVELPWNKSTTGEPPAQPAVCRRRGHAQPHPHPPSTPAERPALTFADVGQPRTEPVSPRSWASREPLGLIERRGFRGG